MKPETKIPSDGFQSVTTDEIQEHELIAKAKRRRQSATWALISIGFLSVMAVVVYSDLSKPARAKHVIGGAEKIAEVVRPAASVPEDVADAERAAPEEDPEKVVVPIPELETAEAEVKPEAEPAAVEVDGSLEQPTTKSLAEESQLILLGMDAGRDEAKSRDAELLGRAINDKKWDDYRALLGKSIDAALSELPRADGLNRFGALWDQPVFYTAMLRWQTLGWFSESEMVASVSYSTGRDFIEWFLNDSEAMEEFLMTIRPEDNAGKVLDFLVYARTANEETFQKYYPLALACAVVFDEPVRIPHPLGSAESGTSANVDPTERYLWYVEKNEKGKLAAPVDRSSARDLIWVVCAPVATSEFEWSLDKMHLRRGKWGNAYGMIEYLMERAVEGLNPYEEYSFAEILKEGGICGDQTYFSVNTARAQGIPAISLSGETNLGGHAWAAIKVYTDEWNTGIGRIGGVSKGQTRDPQTRNSMTEQEIQMWNDRLHQSPGVTLAVWRHLWLADYFRASSDEEERTSSVHLANRIGHSFVETWNALFSLLKEQTKMVGDPPKPENLEEWKAFAADMRREYKDNPRMAQLAATAELEYIFPYGSANDARTAFIRERRRIERDSAEQMDLIAESLKREADLIVTRGGAETNEEISQLYDGALRDYGSSITGFKMMAQHYFDFVKDDPEFAGKAARDIELAFKRVVETGTKEWFRANTETSIYRMICSFYRAAGDEKKAETLERRFELLMRRAKRGAD